MSAASRLALNIETGVNLHRVSLMPEPEVKTGNLKDPVKIEEKIKEAKAEQLAKAAIDANFSRVVCVSFATRLAGGELCHQSIFRPPAIDASEDADDKAEAALLVTIWDQLAKFDRYATFNGSTFDIPFMLRRSLLLGVTPRRIDCHPYRVMDETSEHLDVMRVLQEYETGNGTGYSKNLEFYAALILGQKPPIGAAPGKGEIGGLFEAGQLEPIRLVCEWHATVALELAEAASKVYC